MELRNELEKEKKKSREAPFLEKPTSEKKEEIGGNQTRRQLEKESAKRRGKKKRKLREKLRKKSQREQRKRKRQGSLSIQLTLS